jgi:hypothetical protein
MNSRSWPLPDLAAQQDRHVEAAGLALQRGAVDTVDLAHRPADELGRLEHAVDGPDRLDVAGVGILQTVGDEAQYRLAGREIAGRAERHHPLARLFEHIELAEGGDIVEPRIGAGVRDHNETVLNEDADAIGHGNRRLGFSPRPL